MKIAVLAGDGIGPEIVVQGLKVLRAVEAKFGHKVETEAYPVGWAAIDEFGHALPEEIKQACFACDAVFLGAIGLPDRDHTLPQDQRPERAALLPLRTGNWANLRPIWVPGCLEATNGLRPVDLVIFRELTGGLYFGSDRGERINSRGVREGFDTMVYAEDEIERIVRLAFESAGHRRKSVCSVDKANILATSHLWREVTERVAKEFPEISLRHQLVDSAAPALVQRAETFDVIVTGNMFGDILSDLGACLAGSLGMLGSASIGDGTPLFEPCHGSAPDIAGQDKANPIATILSMEMLLEYALNLPNEAAAVRNAVESVLAAGYRTIDMMAPACTQVGTEQMGDLVVEAIAAQ